MDNKDKLLKKWAPVLENMGIKDENKKNWMSQYAEMHSINENTTVDELKQTPADFPSLLPIVKKVAAQTIGHNLVSVKPMGGPGTLSEEERDRIKGELRRINRKSRIDSILNETVFKERTELTKEEYERIDINYKDMPKGLIHFIDYDFS